MIKKIIFTFILIIVLIFYSCIAAKPIGVFASLQDQENSQILPQSSGSTAEAAETAKTEGSSSISGSNLSSGSESGSSTGKTADEDTDTREKSKKSRISFQSILSKITPKRLQLSLTEKSGQIIKVWASQQSVHGVINVLQTHDFGALTVKPAESLTPFNNGHKVISFLYLCLLGAVILFKTAVSLSVPVICMVIIPILIIYNIIALWKSNNESAHRIFFSAMVTTIIITVAVPVIMKISILADDYVFKKQVNEIVLLLEESEISAGEIDADLRSGRKTNAAIQAHITDTKKLSNTVIKDSFSYILVFTVIYILIPVFASIGLCKLSKFLSKKILRK